MFNYLGLIESKYTTYQPQLNWLNTTSADDKTPITYNYGLQFYSVRIPAVSSSGAVPAVVLSQPGLVTEYNAGDVVLVGELEEKSQSGFTYVILGLLQKENAAADITHTVPMLSVENLVAHTGQIYSAVSLVKSPGAITSQETIELTTLWNEVDEAKKRTQSISPLASL